MDKRCFTTVYVLCFLCAVCQVTRALENCAQFFPMHTDRCCNCSSNAYLVDNSHCVLNCPVGTFEKPRNYRLGNCSAATPGPPAASKTCEPCHDACFDCSNSGNDSCISCNEGYFLYSNHGRSECLSDCPGEPTLYYKDFDNRTCERCDALLCHDCFSKPNITTGEKCQKLCGSSSISTENSFSVHCRTCEGQSLLIEECKCCVNACPENLQARQGRCVKKPAPPKPCKLVLCVGVPVIVCLAVVVGLVALICWRRRKRSNTGSGPAPLPSKHQLDCGQEELPLRRTHTPDGSPFLKGDNHNSKPPTLPPLRTEAEDFDQVVYENEDLSAKKQSTVKSKPIPKTPESEGMPETPDYENKEVVDDIRKNVMPKLLKETPNSSLRNLHQQVPIGTPDVEEETPRGHKAPHSIKGYINKEIIEAHNKEMENKKPHGNGYAQNSSSCSPDHHNSNTADYQQELYLNTQDLVRQGEGPDDDQEDYIAMDQNILRPPLAQSHKNSPRVGKKPIMPKKPVNKPRPHVPAKVAYGSEAPQELYLDMAPQELYLDMAQASRENSARNRDIMDAAVPASAADAGLPKHDYYNEMEQEEYCNVTRK